MKLGISVNQSGPGSQEMQIVPQLSTTIVPFAPWPHYEQDELEAVMDVLRSGRVNYWTGHRCKEFEHDFASWSGTKNAIALANGTVAIELALIGLGLRCGDEVITTPRTFIATSSACVMRGVKPVFADVDPNSGNISAETIEAALTPKTRAIVVVHIGGWPCEMDDIMSLADRHGLKVVEDCAQAHGALYKGQSVGSIGDINAWSFCQDKIVSTGGEGGMVTTNSSEAWNTMWSYKDHGKDFDAVHDRQFAQGGFRWVHESWGTNWRMTEMQAAIGLLQLRKMPQWHEARTRNARFLAERFEKIPGIRVPRVPPHMRHAYYRFYVYVQPEMLRPGWDRDRIMKGITDLGVPCMSGSCSEIYLERAFAKSGFRPDYRLSVAQRLGETSLAFFVHPTLERVNLETTIAAVESVMHEAVEA